MVRLAASLLVLAAALGGCSDEKAPQQRTELDPAISAALNEQLMTDPDLARINPENRVLAGGGPATAPIPLEDRSPEAIARARADAIGLLGRALSGAPRPVGPALPLLPRDTPALAATAALGAGGAGCVGKLEYGFIWAARMPAALPVYPRGHAQDAAGTDREGCGLRAMRFVTPVPVEDVVAFYWATTRRAGLVAEHRMAGGDHVVMARKDGAVAAAFVRGRNDGLSEVDLVSSGL